MNCLSIDGAQLRYELRVISRRLRDVKPHERALIGFDGVNVTIEARETVCFAQVVGTWTGTVRAPATLVAALAASPPAGDRIEVAWDGEHLRIGPLKVAAEWIPISTTLQRAPPAPDWLRGIALIGPVHPVASGFRRCSGGASATPPIGRRDGDRTRRWCDNGLCTPSI